MALDGDDLRKLPLHLRKNQLARLLARRPEGIFVSEFEQGEIGPDLFRAACQMGLEGLVSKRRDSTYRAGRSPNWIKVKNRKHPAMARVMEAFSWRTIRPGQSGSTKAAIPRNGLTPKTSDRLARQKRPGRRRLRA